MTADLEETMFEARSKLRWLRGRLDSYLSEPHPGPVEGYESAADRNAKDMRRLVGLAVSLLDRYDDFKWCNEESEAQRLRVAEIGRRFR